MTETNMNATQSRSAGRSREQGFTLVESLVAIVVLVFGLIAVTNLLLVAASSNTVANQGTAATTSASEVMEVLRTVQFVDLLAAAGGDLDSTVLPAGPCSPAAPPPKDITTHGCHDDITGVGRIVTLWRITPVPGTGRMVFIEVRSEGTGALSRRRSRAEFATFRSCTDSTPTETVGVTVCPDVP
jgi:prepilin-type N-terminal cleavage/methylation domain-containing protein